MIGTNYSEEDSSLCLWTTIIKFLYIFLIQAGLSWFLTSGSLDIKKVKAIATLYLILEWIFYTNMIYMNILLFISVSNWNGWTNWGSCSQQCGGGSQSRSRTCPGNCSGGSGSETRDCNTSPCGECNMYNPCTLACGGICHHFWFSYVNFFLHA